MRYFLLALPALAALPPAAATPIPADALPPPIFPTAVGTKWEYRDHYSEWTETITAARPHKGTTIVSIERKHRGAPAREAWQVQVSRWGAFYVEPGIDLELSHCLFRLPVDPGVAWQGTTRSGFLIQMKQWGAERVTVPAGTFRAIPVDIDVAPHNPSKRVGLAVSQSTMWYVPGVGIVKQRGGTETLLVSFTPGRHTR